MKDEEIARGISHYARRLHEQGVSDEDLIDMLLGAGVALAINTEGALRTADRLGKLSDCVRQGFHHGH